LNVYLSFWYFKVEVKLKKVGIIKFIADVNVEKTIVNYLSENGFRL